MRLNFTAAEAAAAAAAVAAADQTASEGKGNAEIVKAATCRDVRRSDPVRVVFFCVAWEGMLVWRVRLFGWWFFRPSDLGHRGLEDLGGMGVVLLGE